MENNQIYIENIGVGLINLSNLYKLDLKLNEYLVVGQRSTAIPASTIDTEYNMVVNNNGVGINATRREMRDTNAGLLVNNNIVCKGKIIAKSLDIENFSFDSNVTTSKLVELINKVNSNNLFYYGYSNEYNKNIYTPSYLCIGNFASTYSNSHPLKVSDSPNGFASNIQFAIFNNINNDVEPAKFSFGMLGYNSNTPANITTTKGMGLEFHVSKNSKLLDDLYSNGMGLPDRSDPNNYPQLSIDVNGCVNINKHTCTTVVPFNGSNIKPRLYVNGSILADNILMFDNFLKTNLHLDDIYIRKNGLTIKADQIAGGSFTKAEFTFNSNVNIGSNGDKYLLTVNGSATIKDTLTTENFVACKTTINGVAEFNKLAYFNNYTIFNDEISINKSLNVSNDLFIGGYRVNTSNLSYATNGLNYDFGSNLNISGRLGTGVFSIDSYDHQFNIIKRRPERFEIYMNDLSGVTTDSSKVYIGHSTLNYLNGNVDNSLIFLTQKNIRWHNIYFYPGKDKDGCHGFRTLTPTLAIMENNRIGINTNMPYRTLDIIGDLVCSDYYIRKNNIEFKINPIYIDGTNSSILTVNNLDINLNANQVYNNKKTLNVTGAINSYDGYYEGEYRLTTFKRYDNYDISSINGNIGVGVIKTDNSYPIPLQIRNENTNINNNTIIRLYRGVRGGGFNNDALYTGIDFCDYDMPIPAIQNKNNYKWFIYKNHKNKDNIAGVFQVGYTDNSIAPTHSAMNFYYNQGKYFIDINNPRVDYNYDANNAVSIKGNVEIQGNLNLIGEKSTYNINGVVIGSFSNPAIPGSAVPSSYYNYSADVKNDVSIIANKIGLLTNKVLAVGYHKDDWIYQKINKIQNTTDEDNSLIFFYNNKDYLNANSPPVITKFYNKSFKNYTSRPDIATIQLGILFDNTESGTIINKVDTSVKGYPDTTIYEITPNNNTPFISCINKGNKNQVNFGNVNFYTSNTILYPTTAVHINDDFDYLLRLTNNTKAVKVALVNNNDNIWELGADKALDLSYNSNSLFNVTSNGNFILNNYKFSSNNTSTINLNGAANKSVLECTNFYYNDLNSTVTASSFSGSGFISSHFSNISRGVIDNHYDNYDDNLDNNISRFLYTVPDSNLPVVDIDNKPLINFSIANSNYTYNNSVILAFKLNPKNLTLDYKYLDNISVDTTDKSYALIPSLYSYNTNLSAFIKTSNIITNSYNIGGVNLDLKYKIPRTLESDQITINSFPETSNFTSNFDTNAYCNLSLKTFINIKNNCNLAQYSLKSTTNQFMVTSGGSNHYFNTTNKIYYYPIPSITVDEVEINLNYKYNYRNEINVPTNFFNNYTNTLNITSINFSNATIDNKSIFLKNKIVGTKSGVPIEYTPSEIVNSNLSISTIQKIYPIEINNTNVMNAILTIVKNNYFDVYPYDNTFIPIPIYISKYQPHITLKNYINSKYLPPHKIYSYENKYEIHLDNTRLLSLDSNGTLNTSGSLQVKDIYFSGDIYSSKDNSNLTSVYSNLSGSNFYLQKTNISLNSSNIFLNPSVMNKCGVVINRGDIYSSNNLFEINNYNNNNNFLTLKSITDSGFINYFGVNNLYRIGSSNGNFGIWKSNDKTTLECQFIENSFNTFSNVISFNYPDANSYPIINIDGSIQSTSNLSINSITTYVNSPLNYKMRVFGNIKVDGAVMSSSDIRIKNNINKIDNALDKISKLNGITYNNITNDNKKETGLIAQEVMKVIPEAVFEDENGYLNIAYGNLMGVVIEAIKELKLLIK